MQIKIIGGIITTIQTTTISGRSTKDTDTLLSYHTTNERLAHYHNQQNCIVTLIERDGTPTTVLLGGHFTSPPYMRRTKEMDV